MILFIDTHDSLITVALKNNDKLIIKTKESFFSHSINWATQKTRFRKKKKK